MEGKTGVVRLAIANGRADHTRWPAGDRRPSGRRPARGRSSSADRSGPPWASPSSSPVLPDGEQAAAPRADRAGDGGDHAAGRRPPGPISATDGRSRLPVHERPGEAAALPDACGAHPSATGARPAVEQHADLPVVHVPLRDERGVRAGDPVRRPRVRLLARLRQSDDRRVPAPRWQTSKRPSPRWASPPAWRPSRRCSSPSPGRARAIVAGTALYGGTISMLRHILPRFGVEATFVDPTDLDQVRDALPGADLFYCETIVNPTTTVPDLAALGEPVPRGRCPVRGRQHVRVAVPLQSGHARVRRGDPLRDQVHRRACGPDRRRRVYQRGPLPEAARHRDRPRRHDAAARGMALPARAWRRSACGWSTTARPREGSPRPSPRIPPWSTCPLSGARVASAARARRTTAARLRRHPRLRGGRRARSGQPRRGGAGARMDRAGASGA